MLGGSLRFEMRLVALLPSNALFTCKKMGEEYIASTDYYLGVLLRYFRIEGITASP